MGGERTARWIDDAEVRAALASGDTSMLVDAGTPFAMASDRTYCVVIRDHHAWEVEGEGWRSANAPAPSPDERRLALNVYSAPRGDSPGLWTKTFLPARHAPYGLQGGADDTFLLETAEERVILRYDTLGRSMLGSLTTDAEPEEAIEAAFERIRLDSASGSERAFRGALLYVVLLFLALVAVPPMLTAWAHPWAGVAAAALAVPVWLRWGPRPMPGFLSGLLAVAGLVALLASVALAILDALGT